MSLAMHEAQSTCIIPLLEHGAEPKFGNFRGVETLNKRWQEIYRAAGFKLPRHSSTPHPDTCIPSLTVLCKFFVRRHLQVVFLYISQFWIIQWRPPPQFQLLHDLFKTHLHPATATSLQHRSQISSVVLVLYCYTKRL